ncbi:MAG: hypothetical protein M5R36_22195 [Deltaproteobacteria bacterium]|nr:hypothetical protein [Deltaproteobacteria bacterium]
MSTKKKNPRQLALPLKGRPRGERAPKALPLADVPPRPAWTPPPPLFVVPQAPASIGFPVRRFEATLRGIVKRPIRVAYNDNRSQLVSYKQERDGVRLVRISRILLKGSPDVWREVGQWVRSPNRSQLFAQGTSSRHFLDQPAVKEFLEQGRLRRRPVPLMAEGRVYHVGRIFSRLNARYFKRECDATVGYARMTGRVRTRTMQLGAYDYDDNVITIHPVLDWERVPYYVIEAVVFHEMVHWLLRDKLHSGERRCMHPPEFNRHMARYPENDRAEAWLGRYSYRLIQRRSELLRELRRARRTR